LIALLLPTGRTKTPWEIARSEDAYGSALRSEEFAAEVDEAMADENLLEDDLLDGLDGDGN
jgi:hypothetical protein